MKIIAITIFINGKVKISRFDPTAKTYQLDKEYQVKDWVKFAKWVKACKRVEYSSGKKFVYFTRRRSGDWNK